MISLILYDFINLININRLFILFNKLLFSINITDSIKL